MTPEEKRVAKLDEVIDFFDKTHLTTDDFVKSFEVVVGIVRDIQVSNEKEFDLIHRAVDVLHSKMKEDVSSDLQDTKNKVMDYCVRELNKALSGHSSKLNNLDSRIEEVVSQRISDEMRILETIRAEIPTLPELPTIENIRDGLTELPEGQRLPVEAIDGLEKRLTDTVESATKGRVQTPAKAYRVRTADATAQCDGITKAFTTGGTHFGIIGVFGTQFPVVYRPVIDYTETSTGILLTDEVGAPETSQTLIIQFLK